MPETTHVVSFIGKKPQDILPIVEDLKLSGLVRGVDFDFAYMPSSLNGPRHTVFTFYDEQHSSFFTIKYT